MSLLGPVLLLATVFGAGALLIAALVALARRKSTAANRYLVVALGAISSYALLLVLVSLGSRETVLPLHSPKKFCAADCDLAFVVDNAERQADRYIVSVRVLSSAARVTMAPSSPAATLIDNSGRQYYSSDELDPKPFARRIAPGESYVKTLVYRVPTGVRDPRLYISEGGWITRVLVGDENSFLHKRTLVRLRSE